LEVRVADGAKGGPTNLYPSDTASLNGGDSYAVFRDPDGVTYEVPLETPRRTFANAVYSDTCDELSVAYDVPLDTGPTVPNPLYYTTLEGASDGAKGGSTNLYPSDTASPNGGDSYAVFCDPDGVTYEVPLEAPRRTFANAVYSDACDELSVAYAVPFDTGGEYIAVQGPKKSRVVVAGSMPGSCSTYDAIHVNNGGMPTDKYALFESDAQPHDKKFTDQTERIPSASAPACKSEQVVTMVTWTDDTVVV
jgi:catechol 2,3-dioxygenase-like lactoylglutathione lyase family enzyme